VGAPECGGRHELQIKVNLETGVIEDAKFKTFGCGSAIASSSLATEWLKGRTVDEAAKIKNTDIVSELKLPPVKIHCSVRRGRHQGRPPGLQREVEGDAGLARRHPKVRRTGSHGAGTDRQGKVQVKKILEDQ